MYWSARADATAAASSIACFAILVCTTFLRRPDMGAMDVDCLTLCTCYTKLGPAGRCGAPTGWLRVDLTMSNSTPLLPHRSEADRSCSCSTVASDPLWCEEVGCIHTYRTGTRSASLRVEGSASSHPWTSHHLPQPPSSSAAQATVEQEGIPLVNGPDQGLETIGWGRIKVRSALLSLPPPSIPCALSREGRFSQSAVHPLGIQSEGPSHEPNFSDGSLEIGPWTRHETQHLRIVRCCVVCSDTADDDMLAAERALDGNEEDEEDAEPEPTGGLRQSVAGQFFTRIGLMSPGRANSEE